DPRLHRPHPVPDGRPVRHLARVGRRSRSPGRGRPGGRVLAGPARGPGGNGAGGRSREHRQRGPRGRRGRGRH
ncbi:MAG: hypothetical protein AVDCRST_MAG35-803, partial [uncultured Quadrisphaera sp.]